MEKLTAKIVKDNKDDNLDEIIPGGMDAMSWKEYIACFPKEYRPVIRAIRDCVKKSEFKNSTADEFCNSHHFQISNGLKIGFTWRAWGDLLSSMKNKKEGYMKYYM